MNDKKAGGGKNSERWNKKEGKSKKKGQEVKKLKVQE
jgi:hypothetical protein